jgi:PAS domain-containing protein
MLLNARQIQRVLGKERIILLAIEGITDRKQSEEALRESAERHRLERDRLQLILETAQDGFWLVDASTGCLVDVNEAASSILGLYPRGIADVRADRY